MLLFLLYLLRGATLCCAPMGRSCFGGSGAFLGLWLMICTCMSCVCWLCSCFCFEILTTLMLLAIFYTSWGPMFRLFLRSSARAPTIEAVRGTVASKGVFDNQSKGSSVPLAGGGGGSFPLQGHLFPLRRDPFPLRASFNCLIVRRGAGLSGFRGVSMNNKGPQHQ